MKLIDLTPLEFIKLLEKLSACQKAREWASSQSAKEAIETCHRGDWLLWLYNKIGGDFKLLSLAKGHCANTVRHLMKDERSIKAVDTAIAFSQGNATSKELDAAADAAYSAACSAAFATAAADAADAAAAAAAAAAYSAATDAAYSAAADAAADAAYSAAAYSADAAYSAAYYAATDAARTKNRLLTANICRKYLNFNDIEITN